MRPRTRPRKLYDVYNNGEYMFTGNVDIVTSHLKISKGVFKILVTESNKGDSDDGIIILPIEGTDKAIYSFYDGDELLSVGTAEEVAEELGLSPVTIVTKASTNRSLEIQSYNGRYAIAMEAEEAEKVYIEDALEMGFRVFNKCDGIQKYKYEVSKNDVLVFAGDYKEVADYLGCSTSTVHRMVNQPLDKDEFSVKQVGVIGERKYAMYSPDKMLLAYGTPKEVSREMGISESSVITMSSKPYMKENWTYTVPYC